MTDIYHITNETYFMLIYVFQLEHSMFSSTQKLHHTIDFQYKKLEKAKLEKHGIKNSYFKQ